MDQYIDQDSSLSAFCKSHSTHPNLLYQAKRFYPDVKHPSLVMSNLYEIIAHHKSVACIEAPKKSGRTFGTIFALLDQYLKSIDTRDEGSEVGHYMVIVNASREGTINSKTIVDNLTQNIQPEIATVDLNIFFPIKSSGKPPALVLPPVTQPTILLATFYTLTKLKALGNIDPHHFHYCVFDDCNLASIYGGNDQIAEISQWINKNKMTVFVGEETNVETIIGRHVTVAKIEEEINEEEDDEEQKLNVIQSSNFYYLLSKDDVQQWITLYVTLKLSLVQGKTLLIVNTLSDVYHVQLYLQRCQIQRFQIYNHENPKSLKYYILSTFNTGVVTVLVATPQIFQDLETEFYERQKTQGSKKKGQSCYTLKHVDNLIYMNINPNTIANQYTRQVGTQVCLLDNTEENVEGIMSYCHINSNTLTCKEYPLKMEEIEAFRYRIEDVTKNISKHQIKQAEQLDFKKKMLKSPDLVEYFTKNIKEKEILQKQVIDMKRKLHEFSVQLPLGQIPDYLLPQAIRQQKQADKQQNSARVKVLVHVEDQDVEKLKKKRKLLNQQNQHDLLPQEEEVAAEVYQQKERYVNINQEDEDPEVMDPSRLKITSSRKLWKLNHGFKLKKKNKRLEKKGIFTA